MTDMQAVAAEAFAVLDTGRQIAPFSSRLAHFDLDDAYRVTAAVRQMREMRGEVPLGRKIGFTNRTIWDEYQIGAPMWGYIYDRTVHDLADVGPAVSLAGLAEPRIEPEIIFGLAAAPVPGMDERALLGCVDWVAHGFELVQSIFPRWEFTLPDTVAAYGLHGKLLIGPRHPIGAPSMTGRETSRRFASISRATERSPIRVRRQTSSVDRYRHCGTSSKCWPMIRSIRHSPPVRSSPPGR